MTGDDLSTNAILDLILRLPLPSDVAGAHASFRTAPATLFASLRGYVLSERLVLPVRACTARGGTNASGNNGESDKFSSLCDQH